MGNSMASYASAPPQQYQMTSYYPQQQQMQQQMQPYQEVDRGAAEQEFERMKKDHEESKRQYELRMQEVLDEKEREVAELTNFKELASAHLRAQNLTIKRLSSSAPSSSAAESIMDRVRRNSPQKTPPAKKEEARPQWRYSHGTKVLSVTNR